jgi:hypothetical protein
MTVSRCVSSGIVPIRFSPLRIVQRAFNPFDRDPALGDGVSCMLTEFVFHSFLLAWPLRTGCDALAAVVNAPGQPPFFFDNVVELVH